MAGYDGYSKSNNAIDAENDGKFPASILAKKLKVSTAAVKEFMTPCEWHHTSSQFNRTDYYDGELLLAIANDDTDDYDADELGEAIVLLGAMKDYRPAVNTQIWHNCQVKWLEWSGSRKRPVCTEREETGCTVEFNGKSSYKITFADGKTMTKREGTNGFYFREEKQK